MSGSLTWVRLLRAAAAALVRECDAILREIEEAESKSGKAPVSVPCDELAQRAAKKVLRQLAQTSPSERGGRRRK